ncbi:hypothetical protein VIN7_5788 [Saccharomyces cerevisiae x Saccharomyces kudriavzevii VIN7]|uniref:Uncharacterized protein n=1 Tax=Saccharomyces cerevisiae x Saccharomyces kudriavzevii (strain VIN7) TaxID=1095631 RepID=H0GRQ4_SACCK|nr:hypothetical protein VIN7_5788 [Saccharomyces cerevisiae x Saccharomyces kudriavzevii VIN7]
MPSAEEPSRIVLISCPVKDSCSGIVALVNLTSCSYPSHVRKWKIFVKVTCYSYVKVGAKGLPIVQRDVHKNSSKVNYTYTFVLYKSSMYYYRYYCYYCYCCCYWMMLVRYLERLPEVVPVN